jgi:hypothetical protein
MKGLSHLTYPTKGPRRNGEEATAGKRRALEVDEHTRQSRSCRGLVNGTR